MMYRKRLEDSFRYWAELAARDIADGRQSADTLNRAAKLAAIVTAFRHLES